MAAKTGSLSINSENIFPIIKKWLYSDHDIFYRELISNGCDAITKLKKLALMGEYEQQEDEEAGKGQYGATEVQRLICLYTEENLKRGVLLCGPGRKLQFR